MFGMGTGVASPLESPGSFMTRGRDQRESGALSWGRSHFVDDLQFLPRDSAWIQTSSAGRLGQLLKEVKPSTISTAQLHWLPSFHMTTIKQVISLWSYPVDPVGNLISRRASHLDAFSAYPNRTWLPSDALGRTTGTPAVRPLRSSRTRSSSSQVPYARDG